MREIKTASAEETQKIARMLVEKLSAAPSRRKRDGAQIIALQGDLGAGKTTFAQGFARALGVRENVLSPTFVLMKIYDIPSKFQNSPPRRIPGLISSEAKQLASDPSPKFKHLIHIDCYRIASSKDILHLGFQEMLKDKDAIILIEWPERIKKILPRNAIGLQFAHGEKLHERRIKINGSQRLFLDDLT